MCDTEILEPWESGRQKGKVNAAVGSMQRQGAIPGKGETEGQTAEICGSYDGAEEAEKFRGTLELC